MSIVLFGMSLIGPALNLDKLRISLPFGQLFDSEAVISNSYGLQRGAQEFNFTNPAFTSLDQMDQHTFAVLLQTKWVKGSLPD